MNERSEGQVDEIQQAFRDFAESAVARLPLYRRLCEGAAADREVSARLLLATPDQRTPNLLLAAVHDHLLAGVDDPLADWYPSVGSRNRVAADRGRPVGTGTDDPWPHFRRLALEDPGVELQLQVRGTQTNEVGRSATLFPALFQAAWAASSAPPGNIRPIGIVEIGASAGLNLHPDAYGYRYRRGRGDDEEVVTAIGPRSRLVLDCRLRGDRVPPLPEGSLRVDSAVGIDRDPVDLLDPVAARWLEACQWPEQTERLAQLRAAIALARQDPPIVEQGDAVDDLRAHVEAVPAHALPVVVSTWTTAYLPLERQVALVRLLDEIGRERDVAMVFAEQPERVPGLPVPPRPDAGLDGLATALVRVEWRAGQRTEVRLADQHPHGTWLEWF